MASTIEHTLDSEDWVLVSEGFGTVGIQPRDQGLFEVYFADAAEEPVSTSKGFLIGRGMRETPADWSASGFPEDVNVWCRCYNTEDPVTIVVGAY